MVTVTLSRQDWLTLRFAIRYACDACEQRAQAVASDEPNELARSREAIRILEALIAKCEASAD